MRIAWASSHVSGRADQGCDQGAHTPSRSVEAGASRPSEEALSSPWGLPHPLPYQERACILRTVYSIRREEGGDCLFESLAFAWIVGEMALFGRRGDSLKIVDRLSVLVNDPDLQVRLEAVHALGKIGGEVATSALIEVLAAPATSAEMKAKALHASKWWSRSDRASFIKRIDPIVKTYTARLRREIMQQPGLSAGPLSESIVLEEDMLSALLLMQDSGSFRCLIYARCRTALPVNCLCSKRCATSPISCQEASASMDVCSCRSATSCASQARSSDRGRLSNSAYIFSA